MTRDPALEDFAPHVGEAFEIAFDGGPIALALEAASAVTGGQRPSGAFRLVFRGPSEPILPQSIYTIRRGGEALDIFIVPVGRNDAGTEYEAVFF
jgi:hypothetical protein